MLEKAVSEAQTSESRIQNFQQWIYRVDDLLNEHLDNDTTMEDLPHDFQVSASFLTFTCMNSIRFGMLRVSRNNSFIPIDAPLIDSTIH